MRKIKHVVVIIQENRTFDNLFWGYPNADSTTSCAKNHSGGCNEMIQVPLYQKFDLSHAQQGFRIEYDHGKMDGFDLDPGPMHRKNPEYPYQYTQQSDTLPYWQMAQSYTLGDRMFESNGGPSFPAHQILIAGQSKFYENPGNAPWGCDGRPVECFDYQTLGDLLDAKAVSWRYYADSGPTPPQTGMWQAYDAIRHIRFGPDWTNGDIARSGAVLNDIAAGNLAAVTWVTPAGVNSDHPGNARGDFGPEWVSTVVNAVGQSPYWSDAAIIVVWDDWGGWYDHVSPPQLDSRGLGFRVPIMVISPYAKSGYVSHIQHEFGSIDNFIEKMYGLPSMGTPVELRSDDLSDFFDFSQAPRVFSPFAHGPYDPYDTSPPDTE